MINIIIGNIIALAGSIIMVYTGLLHSKKKIVFYQSIQIGLFTFSNLILGGISGFIVNALSLVRNILGYKGKLTNVWIVVILLFMTVFTLIFNRHGIIGLLPLISTIVFTAFFNIKDITKFKYLFIFTFALWGIYDFTIKSYTSCAFDCLSIVTNVLSLFGLNISLETILKKNISKS